MEQLILSAREVYRLAIDPTALQTKATAKQPTTKTYFRASYSGITFTVNQDFMDAFKDGKVAEIVLNKGSRSIDDPLNPGQKKDVESIAFGSYATREQLITAVKTAAEISAIENPKVDGIKLDDAAMNKLQLLLSGAAAV